MAPGDLNSAHFQRLLVDPEVDLAPDPSLGAAMLAGMPLTFKLDPRAVHQQVQRPFGAAIRDVHGQGLLAPGQGAEVEHRPVETDQPQQALDEPGRLSQGHAEQDLHRKTGLGRGVAVALLPVGTASQLISGSNQIVSEPRRLSASL